MTVQSKAQHLLTDMLDIKKYQVVFVLGSQRSGTTLLGQILGTPDSCFLLDEPDGIYEWFGDLFRGGTDTDLLNDRFRSTCQRARNKYLLPDLRCNEHGELSAGITHLIFKSPNLTFSTVLLSRFFPDAYCIFSLRDIRDVVVSMEKINWIPIADNQVKLVLRHEKSADIDVDDLEKLKKGNLEVHQVRALIAKIKMQQYKRFLNLGLKTTQIKYEDLVKNSDEECAGLFRRIGLTDYAFPVQFDQTYVGWGPGYTHRIRPIHSLSLSQWPCSLSTGEERDVWKLTGDFMAEMGYSRADDSSQYAHWDGIASEKKTSPIIVTGRGGSGTRLISVLAQKLGIFCGNEINETEDSVEWVQIIYKIALFKLRSSRILGTSAWTRQLRETAAQIMGLAQWDGTQPWGWKLPESIMIIPEAVEAFSNAKIVHLIRNPVDLSLRRSHLTSRLDNDIGHSVLTAGYQLLGLPAEQMHKDPVYIHNAVSWLYQVEPLVDFGRKMLGSDRYMEIRYEDICSDPQAALSRLADFLGLPVPVADLPIEIEPARQRCWKAGDERANEVWRICGDLAAKLGYEAPLRIEEMDEGKA